MSKISEQKALEAYPEIEGTETYFDRDCICTKPIDLNRQKRIGYINGYDQAMQDFLEKANEFFKSELYVSVSDQICSMNEFKTKNDFINYFKNYMKNEM